MSQTNRYQTRHTLLTRLRDSEHDEASWAEFGAIYRNYVYGIARGMNLSHHDAEDVLQAVMLKVWDKLSEFEYEGGTGKFRAWLRVMTKRVVMNFIRDRKRAVKRESDAAENESYLASISISDIESIADREWQTTLVNLAWTNVQEEIPELQRRIFELDLAGVSRAEIAERLDMPANTVSVYKRRAIARLQREIQWLDSQWS